MNVVKHKSYQYLSFMICICTSCVRSRPFEIGRFHHYICIREYRTHFVFDLKGKICVVTLHSGKDINNNMDLLSILE